MASWPEFDNMNALGENLGVFLGNFFQSWKCVPIGFGNIWKMNGVQRQHKTPLGTKPKPMCIAKKKTRWLSSNIVACFRSLLWEDVPMLTTKIKAISSLKFMLFGVGFFTFRHRSQQVHGSVVLIGYKLKRWNLVKIFGRLENWKKKPWGCWLMMWCPTWKAENDGRFFSKRNDDWNGAAAWGLSNNQVVKEKSGCFFHFHTSFWHSIFKIGFVSIFKSAETTDVCVPCPFFPYRVQRTKCQFQDFRLQHSPKISHPFQPWEAYQRQCRETWEKLDFSIFPWATWSILFSSECWPWLIESFSVALVEIKEYTPIFTHHLLTSWCDFGAGEVSSSTPKSLKTFAVESIKFRRFSVSFFSIHDVGS